MINTGTDIQTELPPEISGNPALLYLYCRIEQIFGITADCEALIKLNDYLEKKCGNTFIKNPAAYESLLVSPEQTYITAKYLTVNETYFFRESAHFQFLADILPDIAKPGRPVKICSAAVSSGCEAYSIAMLLDYYAKKKQDFDFYIDAFDINAEVIETAKNARYTSNAIRSDGSCWKHILDSYLVQDNNEFIVSHNIRKKINFFTHNILSGLEKQYDIIFFRNTLIYFSARNRLTVINNLADSLHSGGLLFLGISETASIKHPLLSNQYSNNVFYFQKTETANTAAQITKPVSNIMQDNSTVPVQQLIKSESHCPELSIDCTKVTEILKVDDGKSNAQNIMNMLAKGDSEPLCGSRIAACAVYYLHIQDFYNADYILRFMEKHNTGAYTNFLRGEYFFLNEQAEEAEKYYNEAAVKERLFWPAFYRIAVLSANGNPVRYEYKIKKTIESIELSQKTDLNYECFLGGFSSDYFRRILEKKLTDKQEVYNG